MLHFDVKIFGTIMCRHFFWQTQISRIAADVASLESCREGPLPYVTLTWRHWTSPDTCPYKCHAATRVWVFLCFPAHCTLRTGSERLYCSVSRSELHWAITKKYRSLLLLFCALNTHTPSNNAVGKGMKQSCDDNWICFNTVTQFCSTVQFRRLLTALL